VTTRRQRQVAELLHEEISMLLQQRVDDPRLALVTVTGVEVTPDLRVAHVYVSIMDDDVEVKETLAGLKRAAGFLRRELATFVSLRYTPELHFRLDSSLEQGLRIDRLLDSLQEKAPGDEGEAE
jgi:ribosome-binding factor A